MVDNRADSGAEPSMEEILSSIKRIIAEEEGGPAARRRPTEAPFGDRGGPQAAADDPDEVDDVLDLDQPLGTPPLGGPAAAPSRSSPSPQDAGPGTPPQAAPYLGAFTGVQAQPVRRATPPAAPAPPPVQTTSAPEAEQAAPPLAAPAPASERASAVQTSDPDASPRDSILSAGAADATRGSLQSLSRLIVRPDASAAGDNTLEGLVREMLKPMLRDWLDANLPELVETLVAREIERITGQAR